MDSLKKANDVMSQIATKYAEITPIAPTDVDLFNAHFAKEHPTYGNSWPYIIQGMYGIGPHNLGYKYFDGKNLSALCVYPHVEDASSLVFYWVRPMGKEMIERIATISKKIHATYHIPVAATKLFKTQYDFLLTQGFKEVNAFPWHHTAPAEDDTYPEIINDVEATLLNKEKRKRIYKAKRQFEKISPLVTVKQITTEEDKKDAWTVAENFFKQHLASLECNLSTQYDYYNMIYNTDIPHYFMYIIKQNDKPVGFFDYYHPSGNTAYAYCSLMLRAIIPNLEDFTMLWLFNHLKQQQITFLNQGGSETTGIHEYKQKFMVAQTITMNWAVFI